MLKRYINVKSYAATYGVSAPLALSWLVGPESPKVPLNALKNALAAVGLTGLVVRADPEADITDNAFTARFNNAPLLKIPGKYGYIGAYIVPGVGIALFPAYPGVGAPAPIYLGLPA